MYENVHWTDEENRDAENIMCNKGTLNDEAELNVSMVKYFSTIAFTKEVDDTFTFIVFFNRGSCHITSKNQMCLFIVFLTSYSLNFLDQW